MPLFAITDDDALLARFRMAAALNRNKASQFDIYATLAVCMGLEPDSTRALYGPSLFDPLERLGRLTYGSILGRFGAAVKWKVVPEDAVELLRPGSPVPRQ